MSRIAVIGAGVTGVTTAYELARRNHEVCIFDAREGAAMETSFANGGQISASNAEVWNTWPTIRNALGTLLRKDAPLRISPHPDGHKISWFAGFFRAGLNHRRNTLELANMAIQSRAALRDIARREDIRFDMNDCGLLHVYRTPQQFDIACRANQLLNRAGLERHAVSADDINRIEPALAGDYAAGLFTPDDFAGDIHAFTRGLADICRSRGVTFHLGHSVTGLEVDNGKIRIRHNPVETPEETRLDEFERIVICAGVGSRRLAQLAGDRVNVYPVKGYSLTVDITPDQPPSAAPTVCLLDEEAKIVTSRLGNRLRIAGLAEFSGEDKSIDPQRAAILSRWCREHFPRLDQSNIEYWAGLRPMMPRMVPKIGRGRLQNVFYNTGHGHLGWTLSAGSAARIADIIDAAR